MKCAGLKKFIAQAIEFEMKSAEFYNKAAEIVDNEDAEIMLRALRSQEVKHAKLLMDFNPEEYKNVLVKTHIDFFPDDIASFFAIDDTDDSEAIRDKAISFEKQGWRTYQNFAGNIRDANIREFFNALSKLEVQHLDILHHELAGYYQ